MSLVMSLITIIWKLPLPQQLLRSVCGKKLGIHQHIPSDVLGVIAAFSFPQCHVCKVKMIEEKHIIVAVDVHGKNVEICRHCANTSKEIDLWECTETFHCRQNYILVEKSVHAFRCDCGRLCHRDEGNFGCFCPVCVGHYCSGVSVQYCVNCEKEICCDCAQFEHEKHRKRMIGLDQ